MSELNMAKLQEWIGNTESRTDIVSEDALKQYRGTLESYLVSEDVAVVPPGFHWTMYQPLNASSELREDGHPKRITLLPELPFATRMWAGGEVAFHAALKVGDRIERTSTLKSIDLKSGSSGDLLFIEIAHEYQRNQQAVISETQTVVYRNPPPPKEVQPLEEQEKADEAFQADSRLLFRYSALTFNTHRIHYDRDYAMREEGYPGLVVHGPMQASLLMNHIAGTLGHTDFRFSYRGTAPLFAGQNAYLRLSDDAAWIERGEGDATMKGKFQLLEQ
ncbi:FAS1-like dehydratase domain-containing protein [Ponticaulis profundi]|uniref:MaoC family dehydratase N-terminal domain-containing protein n=1 Tax=Ponticaulis profundi TaxID=2665222 RepID=A0ABW1SAC0_9PROT